MKLSAIYHKIYLINIQRIKLWTVNNGKNGFKKIIFLKLFYIIIKIENELLLNKFYKKIFLLSIILKNITKYIIF